MSHSEWSSNGVAKQIDRESECRVGVVLAQDVCVMQGGMQIDEYKIGGPD